VRGELDSMADTAEDDLSGGGPQIAACEHPFAHPVDLPSRPAEENRIAKATKPQVFAGTVKRSGKDVRLTRAPLAQFVSAS